jgi:hypothetical protein
VGTKGLVHEDPTQVEEGESKNMARESRSVN